MNSRHIRRVIRAECSSDEITDILQTASTVCHTLFNTVNEMVAHLKTVDTTTRQEVLSYIESYVWTTSKPITL